MLFPRQILPWSSTSLQSVSKHTCCTIQQKCNNSHGVRSPSTLEDIWSPHSQVYLAWSVTLSGFRNLLALCFSRSLLALFHASNALGVLPFRVFPPTPSLDILSVSRAFLSLASQDRLDFKALIRVWVRCISALIQESLKPDTLLGFHPLQGILLSRVGNSNRDSFLP